MQSVNEAKSVICLWGAHRHPGRDDGTPNQVDKGIRELEAWGYDIHSIYPQLIRERMPAFFRWILGNRLRYKLAAPALVKAARANGSVVYTSDSVWAHLAGSLKTRGAFRNRLIIRWAGFDLDYDELTPRSKRWQFYEETMAGCDVCWVISLKEVELLRRTFPEHASKVAFWPTTVDVPFYARFADAPANNPDADVVAVGTDKKRDWRLPLALAAQGIRVTLLTGDASVATLIEQLEPRVRSNVTFILGADYGRSAEIVATARCILLATLPNFRFSGATTVGMASAMKKPLVLDEPYDLTAYGLIPGINCETFVRGDAQSALDAVNRVLGDPARANRLAISIGELAKSLEVSGHASALARSFRPDWSGEDFLTRRPT